MVGEEKHKRSIRFHFLTIIYFRDMQRCNGNSRNTWSIMRQHW
uniref:Uncharacterized protein n=1 Tax=Rhizophora mucronata TaxID=61149 RepID=A0A2P2QWZ2_RHIMU